MPQTKTRFFVASALAVTIGLSFVPTSAQAATSAELQSQLDQAQKKLNSLYSAAEQAGYELDNVTSDLNNTKDQISSLETQISEEKQELKDKQSQLSEILADQYKANDGTSLVSLFLSSSDFGELVSNMHYASKVSEQKTNAIQEVRDLQASLENNKNELETRKTEQEKLVSEQQAKSDSANAAASEAQSYYDQLSDEVKNKLAEEEAAARAQAEQEAKAAVAAAPQQAQSSSGSNGSSFTSNSSANSNSNSNSGSNSSSGSGGSSSNSGNTGGSANAASMVSRALSAVGSSYRWSGYVWTGSTSSSAFTCSGLIDFALGRASNSSWPESLYASCRYITTNRSALNYGDLVFYKYGSRYPGHVGIYLGNGKIVDSIPNGGVQIRSLDYPGTFIGGGPIV